MNKSRKRRLAVAPLDDIPEGQAQVYEVGEHFLAICRIGDEVWAVEDRCTHDDGPLGEGCLHGHEIECPRHGARFDVRDGSICRMPAIGPVPTFPTRVEGGWVIVDLPS